MSSKNIKLSVANLAAQLIMEEGIKDYLYAKKKAAKSLGIMKMQTSQQIHKLTKQLTNLIKFLVQI